MGTGPVRPRAQWRRCGRESHNSQPCGSPSRDDSALREFNPISCQRRHPPSDRPGSQGFEGGVPRPRPPSSFPRDMWCCAPCLCLAIFVSHRCRRRRSRHRRRVNGSRCPIVARSPSRESFPRPPSKPRRYARRPPEARFSSRNGGETRALGWFAREQERLVSLALLRRGICAGAFEDVPKDPFKDDIPEPTRPVGCCIEASGGNLAWTIRESEYLLRVRTGLCSRRSVRSVDGWWPRLRFDCAVEPFRIATENVVLCNVGFYLYVR